MYNYDALALLLADAIVLAVIVLQPLSRRFDDSDQGRGTVVKLPPFGRQSLPRVGIFLLVAVAVGTLPGHRPSSRCHRAVPPGRCCACSTG